MTTEPRDTTISDIHQIRRELVARFGGDLRALTADAQRRAEASGRQIIRKPSSTKPLRPPDNEPPQDG